MCIYNKVMRQLTLSLVGFFLACSTLFVPAYSSSADELTDAQSRLKELQNVLDQDSKYINIDFPRESAQTNECIVKYTNAQEPEDQDKHQACELTLAKLQSEQTLRVARISTTTEAIAKLNTEIAKLRASNSNSGAGSSTTSSQVSPSPSPSSSSQSTNTPITPTSNENTQNSSPVPTTTTEQKSAPASVSGSPAPKPSTSVSANRSVMPSPKLPAKKTITCIKGKTVKTVTAVKPTCPKGFKQKIK